MNTETTSVAGTNGEATNTQQAEDARGRGPARIVAPTPPAVRRQGDTGRQLTEDGSQPSKKRPDRSRFLRG